MSGVALEMILVATGGATGCIARYGTEHIKLFANNQFNTVVTNLTGCLLIGILWVIIGKISSTPESLNRLLITGFLGGFTTFSAFSLHPILMLRNGQYTEALVYIAITVVGGIAACALGMWGTEKITRLI